MRYIVLIATSQGDPHINTLSSSFLSIENIKSIGTTMSPVECLHGIYKVRVDQNNVYYAIPEIHPFFTTNIFVDMCDNSSYRSIVNNHTDRLRSIAELQTKYFNDI